RRIRFKNDVVTTVVCKILMPFNIVDEVAVYRGNYSIEAIKIGYRFKCFGARNAACAIAVQMAPGRRALGAIDGIVVPLHKRIQPWLRQIQRSQTPDAIVAVICRIAIEIGDACSPTIIIDSSGKKHAAGVVIAVRDLDTLWLSTLIIC